MRKQQDHCEAETEILQHVLRAMGEDCRAEHLQVIRFSKAENGRGGGSSLRAGRAVGCAAAELVLRIRYASPGELGRGSLVGPLARDLGLSPAELPARKMRIVSSDEKQYFTLGEDNANLRVNERIDRESICGAVSPCVLSLEAFVENPFNIFHVSVTVQDINDNAPQFDREFVAIEMIESTPPGARFPLGSGRDPDIGANSLQNYQLTPDPHFSLVVTESPDGTKQAELVLEKSLDREKQRNHHLILTAVDGGNPVRSGTTQLKINVTDANDNPPVFTKEIYMFQLLENLPEGSLAFQVKATDSDEGTNAEITYSFSGIAKNALQVFSLDSRTGDVKVTGPLDYEEGKYYEATVEGKDGGGLTAHAKVHIDILDVNDNAPTITILPILNPVPEDSEPRTVIAVINVRDRDSGDNGKVSCNIDGGLPFRLESSSANTYKLIIASGLDREQVSAYNITITARDRGSPSLWSRAALVLEVSDVNDNAPVFEEASYSAYVAENNAAGALVVRVRARDADAGANGRRWDVCGRGGGERWGGQRSAAPGACSAGRRLRAPLLTEEEREEGGWGGGERALLWGVLVAAWEAAWGQLRYSVAEELPKGSFVGDVAKDLALDLPALRDRGVRILDRGRTQYFALHGKSGHLVTAERIDREQLCESAQQCVLRCELIAEGDMKVYEIEVEITDINDNAPSFREAETELRISEITPLGSRFPLRDAQDPDVG
ncbi:PREDICTED: protocadherin gamma-B3-like, partial [Chaetura pelagica]